MNKNMFVKYHAVLAPIYCSSITIVYAIKQIRIRSDRHLRLNLCLKWDRTRLTDGFCWFECLVDNN